MESTVIMLLTQSTGMKDITSDGRRKVRLKPEFCQISYTYEISTAVADI